MKPHLPFLWMVVILDSASLRMRFGGLDEK